jgi:hypothetical protein
MTGAITDFSTPITKVRALIPDIERLDNPSDPTLPAEYLFSDQHLQTFLDLFEDNVFLAAAQALDTLASSEALISKVMQSDDLKTDGAKTAAALKAQAAALREQGALFGFEDLAIVEFAGYGACGYELAHRTGIWWPDL